MCPDLARSVEAAAAELKAKRERDLNRQQSRISLSPAKQRLSTLRSSRSSADLASRSSAERPQSPSRGRDTDGDDDAGPLVVDPSDPAALAAGTPPASTRSSTRGSTSQIQLTKSLFGNRKGSKRKDSEGSRRGGLSGSVRSTARVRPSSVEADPDDPDGGHGGATFHGIAAWLPRTVAACNNSAIRRLVGPHINSSEAAAQSIASRERRIAHS